MNPERIDPSHERDGSAQSIDSYLDAKGYIRHELRHAYQASTLENPDNYMVSSATIYAWQSNYPRMGGEYTPWSEEQWII
jgi:hypothetical protein